MAKTILQVPIDISLRQQAQAAAYAQGFSSLQEAVRIFLHGLANKETRVKFEEPAVQLSPKAVRRYNRLLHNIETGKEPVYEAKSVKDLMKHLMGS